jgi:hypothetical protein
LDRSYIKTFTVSAANTDTEYTLTIPGDTTGTWLTDTSLGVIVTFTLACGSTFQGTDSSWQSGNLLGTSSVTNGMGTGGNVFELYDVGLHLDPDATGVAPKWQTPDYASELAACQRYWESMRFLITVEANKNQSPFEVIKRVTPTLSLSLENGSGGSVSTSDARLVYQNVANSQASHSTVIGNARM